MEAVGRGGVLEVTRARRALLIVYAASIGALIALNWPSHGATLWAYLVALTLMLVALWVAMPGRAWPQVRRPRPKRTLLVGGVILGAAALAALWVMVLDSRAQPAAQTSDLFDRFGIAPADPFIE